MAEEGEGGGGGKKKAEHKVNKYQLYETGGEGLKRKNKTCPRCGPGIYLAAHANRLSCGACGYTESVKGKE